MKLNYILTSVDKFVLKRTIFKDALQSAHDCMDLLDFIAHFKIKLPDSNLASIVTDFEDFYLNGEYNDKDEDCDNLNLIISLSSFLKLNYLDIDQKIFKGICIALIKRLDTLIINEYPCDDLSIEEIQYIISDDEYYSFQYFNGHWNYYKIIDGNQKNIKLKHIKF